MNIDRCELTRKHTHSHMSTQTRTHMLKFMQAHMSSQPMSWGLKSALYQTEVQKWMLIKGMARKGGGQSDQGTLGIPAKRLR